jgi:CBS domain-containing protein
MRAREFMSTPVTSVRPEATLKEVVEQMVSHHVSGVPVIDHRGTLVGIVSESDVLTKVEYGQPGGGLLGLLDRLAQATGATRKLAARTAAELMTASVITAGPEASFRELLHLMTVHDVNRIPIVGSGRVIGIVTRADLLGAMARSDEAISEKRDGACSTISGSIPRRSRSAPGAASSWSPARWESGRRRNW